MSAAGSHAKPAVAEEPASKRVKTQPAADASAAAAAAAPAAEAEAFVAPADWPKAGPIDLSVADLPKASADTEWWYTNGHVLDTSTGHDFSFYASFFRIVTTKNDDGTLSAHTHAHHTHAHTGRHDRRQAQTGQGQASAHTCLPHPLLPMAPCCLHSAALHPPPAACAHAAIERGVCSALTRVLVACVLVCGCVSTSATTRTR